MMNVAPLLRYQFLLVSNSVLAGRPVAIGWKLFSCVEIRLEYASSREP
jgi:hypothetical protein